MLKHYTKKPVTIQAVKFEYNSDCLKFLKEWMGSSFLECNKERSISAVGWLLIATLEGHHVATEGDYIIKGVKGEFYACKPDIFGLTYSPANENSL